MALGKTPLTSARPPVLAKGTTSEEANRIFSSTPPRVVAGFSLRVGVADFSLRIIGVADFSLRIVGVADFSLRIVGVADFSLRVVGVAEIALR